MSERNIEIVHLAFEAIRMREIEVITLRDGTIVRHRAFGGAEEALEAVGLPLS
jgi:hypothetical protein